MAAPETQRVNRLIAGLDAAGFSVRKQAGEELAKFGELAVPRLQQALDGKPPLEVRQRIEDLLATVRTFVAPDTLRALRGIEVLERIWTTEAKAVLEKLAKGAV